MAIHKVHMCYLFINYKSKVRVLSVFNQKQVSLPTIYQPTNVRTYNMHRQILIKAGGGL